MAIRCVPLDQFKVVDEGVEKVTLDRLDLLRRTAVMSKVPGHLEIGQCFSSQAARRASLVEEVQAFKVEAEAKRG